MKKKLTRLISAVLSAAMALTSIPFSAFAEDEVHTHDSESKVITTPLDFRGMTADNSGDGWSWEYDTKTLTLDGVNIQATTDDMSVVTVPDGTEIVLKGENTIIQTDNGDSYTYVLSAVNNEVVNCDGTMTISGDGVLNVENLSTSSMMRSLGGTIIINGGTVKATGKVVAESLEIHNYGALNANASATSFDGAAVYVDGGSITVDGNGSLTAVGAAIADESRTNSAIILNSNFGDKIFVSGNGSITVPESNGARLGICYDGNKSRMDAEISGGKVTAYGTVCGVYQINLTISGSASLYATGSILGIERTDTSIDEDEFVIKGSTEFKADESAVTDDAQYVNSWYCIGEDYAKTVVIKPDTEPSIKLGKQIGAIYADEEGNTSTAFFYITEKNFADGTFNPEVEWVTSPGSANIDAHIRKTDGDYVCEVICDEFNLSRQYELRIKSGEVYSNTVTVNICKPHFSYSGGDWKNKYYTNYNGEQYILLEHEIEAGYENTDGLQYNWSSASKKYDINSLGTASFENGTAKFIFSDNVPEGSYVVYCDVVYNNDNGEAYTLTERFAFTFEECKHTGGFTDGICNNCKNPCGHSDINAEDGICKICGEVASVALYTGGDGTSMFVDADELHSILTGYEYEGSGAIKLFKDYSNKTTGRYYIGGEVTIDLNGHTFNVKGVNSQNGGKVTFKNSGSKQATCIGSVNPSVDGLGNTLIVYGDIYFDSAINATANSTVILYGGKYVDLTIKGSRTLYDMLGEGRAFFDADGNLFNAKVQSGSDLTVKEHSHTYTDGECGCGYVCPHDEVDAETGKCTKCEYQYAAVIVKDGAIDSVYKDADMATAFKTADSADNKGCTLKVFKNYTGDYTTLNGEFTLWLDAEVNVGTIHVLGDITVTGLPENSNFTYGSFNVLSGGKLTFDKDCRLSGNVSVGAGTFDCYNSFGINLIMHNESSNVTLYGGWFTGISYNGEGDRENAEILTLLADNRMFTTRNGQLIDGSLTTLKNGFSYTVIVIDHEHAYDSTTGKCVCGKRCGHTDVDADTGVCKTCKYQFVATLTADGKTTGFDSLKTCLDSATADTENYVKLYKDIEYSGMLLLAVRYNVTFDLNGHEMNGYFVIGQNDESLFTITGKEGSYVRVLHVYDTAVIDENANIGFQEIHVFEGGQFTVNQGANVTTNNLYVYDNTENEQRTSVKLATGMKISNTLTYDYKSATGDTNAAWKDLLADNQALEDKDGNLIDLYKKFLKQNLSGGFTVVEHNSHTFSSETGKCDCGYTCEHNNVDKETGICGECGFRFAVGVSGAGTAKYFDNIEEAFNTAVSEESNGCTLTLYKNCELSQVTEIRNATVTVDVNGYSLGGIYAEIDVIDDGVLYLKDSGNGGINTPIIVSGGTLINGSADDSSSAVDIYQLGVQSAESVKIYGGRCENLFIENASGIALYGGSYGLIHGNENVTNTPVSTLLAKGYAFATLNDVTHLPEKIVDGSTTTIGRTLENVVVLEHTHTYDETNTKCACGAVLYATVTTADGTVVKFDNIEEGLLYADKAENKGCVFTLVTDGELKNNITLSSGQFTITAINGNYIKAPTRNINIKGAEITVENCDFDCFVGLYSGSLTYPEGSTSVCNNGISVFGGTLNISDGVSETCGASHFVISAEATDAKVTIGGGTFNEINLGQYTLKDILASGIRLISVEYSQDTEEITATNNLLYSDVSGQSKFGVDDDKDYQFVKCDHKVGSDSYALENGVCKYCNSAFVATVSYTTDDGEQAELFADIFDAFAKANEVGTATITLQKNITGELSKAIEATGSDITLDLNGKHLRATYDSWHTVEVMSGKFTVKGDSILNYVTVYEGAEAVIQGGIFSCLKVNDGGNAEIAGGRFGSVSVSGNGRTIEDLLAEGYGYKDFNGNYWISVAKRETQGIGNVTVKEAPIKNAGIAWADEESPVVYRNGSKSLNVDVMYELADKSKKITYSDFANGNNVRSNCAFGVSAEGPFYAVSGAEIGRSVAEDGNVEYYIVFKCDGYEYKSNVLKFTLATCSHENRAEEDGVVKCKTCDTVLYFEITTANGVYYEDNWDRVITAVASNEGSTVKLISDSMGSYPYAIENGTFTIDLNGKATNYEFDVNGGDITFTSSAIFDGSTSYRCNVTVSGSDTNVTINGKAEFSQVTLSAGKLTINSTEAYIEELSIAGGNVDIDGAQIDSLTFSGGDLTIRNITAGSLDINSKVSGASEHNIVIESGSFDTITCSDDSGYNIVKALASERRLRGSESGIIYEYSEIESLTEDTDITVEKCDHKYANGNFAVDDDYVCYYCHSQIAATVSYTADGSEQTDLFGDICDAFDKANEVGTATVTLRSDIADSEIAHEINVTGNVALELNTKTLGATDKANNIYISGGTLTVNGNGKVWSQIEAKPDSKLTITNGEYNNVYALSGSDVVILDGIIDCLSVFGTGKAEVSGGKFTYLFMYNGKAIESVLADGYAYKNADGTWLSIDERESKSNYLGGSRGALSVEEAPIKSASIAWKDGESLVVYRNGAKNYDVTASCRTDDTSKEITYSDFLNSNVYSNGLLGDDAALGGTSYALEGSGLGAAIAEDGPVEYYCIFTCDGYEYKSNVLEFTLATCLHEDLTNEDGIVTCDACGYYLLARVETADGEVTYYDDIVKALAAAAENEGSTLTLVSRIQMGDSVPISGGKFTVDLAGVPAQYTFEVTDGDITFKSSEEFSSDYSDRCNITVNGSDAKVTIDGKIELEAVQLSDGTFTTNSTEADIIDLSIDDGKADIDGAYIRTITIHGGDTVIKDVVANTLSMDGYWKGNISIVSGRFHIVTFNGYTLGKAIASGSRVRGTDMYTVLYKYSEIQSMTVTDTPIIVEKCDHKDKYGNAAINDDGACIYCNSQIAAIVSYTADGGEKTDAFADICDAFDKANEAGTATVTLRRDISWANGDVITRNIVITGDVTLELGKYNFTALPSSSLIATFVSLNGATLTVNGEGSMLYVAADYKSKIIVNGGKFEGVDVYEDSEAEIHGGKIKYFDIRNCDGVEISGGKIDYLCVEKGKTAVDALADGYAYKNADDIWLSISEREVRELRDVTVEEAPIKSATISAKDESPLIYRNGDQSVGFTAEATYSEGETLYVTGCLTDGTVIRKKTEFNGSWYLFGSEVNKAVAEDGEIQYYCIFTCDGYDYKSNVVTLTVDTCQHPSESVECDDQGYYECDICNVTLQASVELSDGTLSYYGYWNDAISAAEENDGCTLKLLYYRFIDANEIFDINKGRFTVDFNKIDVNIPFAFNVKGGDITFTASQAGSVLWNEVYVSGENANVLIDSKAELSYLVVNSGKATIDGALINKITINGGESVIKVTDSQEDNTIGTTLELNSSETEYSVTIEGGFFNSVTCQEGSGYTLGKALAKGTTVMDDAGRPFNYSDISVRTNVTGVFVEKCMHIEGGMTNRVALDSSGRCIYCNNEYAATVSYMGDSGLETVDLFENIYDAFDKANEKGVATVTLYKDIADSELTSDITVTGNITLELNGKKLGDSHGATTILASNGGTFTVNGDGKIGGPVDVKNNSKLTVNSGELDWVTIYEGGDAVISGGSISAANIYGNAKISGGKFYIITVYGTLESVLADGYAYKVDGGAWLSIEDRAKSSYRNGDHDYKPLNVEEAPVLSAELKADKTKVYRNGAGKVRFSITTTMRDGNIVDFDNMLVMHGYAGGNAFENDETTNAIADANVWEKDSYLSTFANGSDSVEVYYTVKYNGYELRTNIVTFEVATCDHPADQVVSTVDDKLICLECENTIYAEITNGDSVRYYDDFEEAMYDAQLDENKGCTVTVTSDTSDINYITLYSGQFTLDLAGHKVEFVEDRTTTITGADVTIKDSVGGGSISSGQGIARVITVQNAGKVTLESGTIVNNIYITSGKLDMCGAIVENTVEIGANAKEVTIRDGSVINGTLDVSADADPTHIKLSGGWYSYVAVGCSDFAQVLVKDKRLLKDNGGYYEYSELCDPTCKPENFTIVDCDHKDADGSMAFDSSYACEYCGTKFVARVRYTAGGATVIEYFESIYEAFDKANTIDDSLVDILNNVEGQLDKPLTVTGNITLDHDNNSGISAVSDDGRSITVADGGILKLTGRDCHIENIFVEYGGLLYVNGGTYGSITSYGYTQIFAGTFGELKTDAIGGISALLSGECGYKNANGEWLTVAEREADSAENVTVDLVPLYGASLSADTNTLYRNSNNETTVKFDVSINAAANIFDGNTGAVFDLRYVVNSNETQDKHMSLKYPYYDDTLKSSEICTLAGDSDVAQVYYIITYDGYEVRTNTVSINLVDCEHPSASIVDPTTNEETGGNVTKPTYCDICKTQFHAKIENGDSVKYYNDLYEAVADAQKSENEGCTLYPLYDKNGYKEQIVISGGKFTFRLLTRAYLSKPVIIKGDADLTIFGRSLVTNVADKIAVIVEGGNVKFAGLATDDVIINGGNVTMGADNIRHLTINGGNVSIRSGQFAEFNVTVAGKVIADYIVPGNWVQDAETKEWIDIFNLESATASSEFRGMSVRICPMWIVQPKDAVYYTNGYYPSGVPSLEVDATAQYTAEVNPAIAYQWFSVDENGNETEIEGATGKTLSLENLTTGKYYCRITYSNATTAGISMKSDVVTATITECEHSGGEATCTNRAVCEICGSEYGDLLPHNYELIKEPQYLKSAADCTNADVYYLVCTMCWQSSEFIDPTVTKTVGEPLGHKYGKWISNGNGTHTRVCANDSKHTETKDCHGGTATCTAKAICEDCGAEYGEMTAHTFTAKTATAKYLKTAATCTAKAVYYTSCADCGLSSKGTADEATFEYGNALGHKYGKWISNGNGTHTRVCANDNTHTETKDCHGGTATCTAKAICEDCGAEYGEMTAHTFTAKSAVSRYLKTAATCTEKSEYYVSCADCGLSSKGTADEATFEGSALGHALTKWNVTDASCTENGSKERHCTRCDYKQTQTIPAKGHTFGEWKITKNVGCVTDGEQTRECAVCGGKETKIIAATGVHVYGEWKVTKAPTCTTAGVKERTCTGCNAKETMTLQATGHKYTASTVKPTYSAKGYTLYKCSLCGNSYKSNYTNMLVLSSVSGLKATSRTDRSVTLSWNRNANAAGYVIEYYDGAKWVKKSTVTKNTTLKYTVSSMKPSTVNKFRIRAYNATNYSAYSYITVTTLPSAVSGFKTVSKTSSTATLCWNKNTSADGYIIDRYIGNKWIQTLKVVGNGNVSATVKSLTAGSTNKLRIRAYKTLNKKTEYSSYTYLDVRTKPAQMTGLKAKSKTNNTVTLQWNKNTTADSVFIEKYDGSKWVNVTKLSAGTTTYTVRKLSSGRTYRFRIRAYKAGEYSGYTYLNVNTRPYTTTGMKSKNVTKNSIVLQWNKNTSADGYSIEKYDGKKWVQVKRYTSNNSTTYTIKSLKAGTTYKFRMRAYKTIGSVNEYSAYTYCNVTTAK